MSEPWAMNRVLAIEGLWGVGKTTVARQAAAVLGGVYVKPLAGAVAAAVLQRMRSGDPAGGIRLARSEIERCLVPILAGGLPVICDRHWLSVCALTTEEFWTDWRPRPPTVLLTADPAECERRLAARGHRVIDRAEYIRHSDRLLELARRLGARLIANPPGRAAAAVAAVALFATQSRGAKNPP